MMDMFFNKVKSKIEFLFSQLMQLLLNPNLPQLLDFIMTLYDFLSCLLM